MIFWNIWKNSFTLHVANTHRTHLPIPFLSLGKRTKPLYGFSAGVQSRLDPCPQRTNERKNNVRLLRKCDSGRPRTFRTSAHISDVNDLVLSQKGARRTHQTSRQIARKTGIHRSSVVRIIRDVWKTYQVCEKNELPEANCINRWCLATAKELLRKYQQRAVNCIFFTGFHSCPIC